MSADYTIRSTDTAPSVTANLLQPDGTPAPISGATISFYAKQQSAGSTFDVMGLAEFTRSCTIADATTALVSCKLDVVDTQNAGGLWFNCYYIVVYGDGTQETFPNDHNLTLYVTPR
jgi:hypothetical protein